MRRFGDLDLAEDVASEAIEVALVRWPVDGVPPRPGAWLMTTARRRAIDRLRRDQAYAARRALLQVWPYHRARSVRAAETSPNARATGGGRGLSGRSSMRPTYRGGPMPEASRPALVLGPVLRRVDGRQATVWVQTARPGTVEVRAGEAAGAARTFTAHQRHYALVVVDGLPAGATIEYQVLVDGRHDRYPPDALDAYAVRLAGAVRAGTAASTWPDTLVLLGDQVYADETSPRIRGWLRRRRWRRRRDAPTTQVVSFGEYVQLYLESWTDPQIRWLMSTVPSVMIFDDHEIIDDWNTSQSWRADRGRQSWWAQRIAAGLSSYWVYQHLGNLAPDELAKDPVYREVCAAADATAALADFGARADADRDRYRWSYALDIGRTRLVMLDNRAGRELRPGQRLMLPDGQWRFLAEAVRGDHDHLVIGSSLPWLLAPAFHHVEAMNERLCESPRGWIAAPGEWLRQQLDLEHWAAFGHSFDALGALVTQLGTGPDAPATISVLSGDVHHSYVSRAHLGAHVASAVHQLTCSPVHNDMPRLLRVATRLGWSRAAATAARGLAALADSPAPAIRWELTAGPYFGNAVSTLVHDRRTAHVTIERSDKQSQLQPLTTVQLRT